MNMDRFQNDHVYILTGIATLRRLARDGIEANAEKIAAAVVQMSGKIKLHLAAEDSTLYPTMTNSSNVEAVDAAQRFQAEMGAIAKAYARFASRWNLGGNVAADPEGFRRDANDVLKVLFQRMQRENTELYPLAARV